MVINGIVEPGGSLNPALGGGDDHRIGVIGILEPREIGRGADLIGIKARIDRFAGNSAATLIRIIGHAAIWAGVLARAFGKLDDVRSVVRDDVHVDFKPARVRVIDQLLEIPVASQMRVDPGEVGNPVAVITRAFVSAAALHRPVDEHRGQPDDGRAEPLDVIELAAHALKVAAMIETLVCGVEAGDQAVTAQPTAVVRTIGVGEPVGHQQIDDLVLRQPRAVIAGRRGGGGGGGDRERGGDHAGTAAFAIGPNLATNAPWSGIPLTSATCARSSPSRNSRSRASGSRSAIGCQLSGMMFCPSIT